jgi:hypothetical protein
VRPDNTGVIPVDVNLGDFHVPSSTISLTSQLNISETLQINGESIVIASTDTVYDVISKINAVSYITGVSSYIDSSTIVLK